MIDKETLDLVIQELSEAYRTSVTENQLLNIKIKDIKVEMKYEAITYKRMNDLKFLLELKTQRYEAMKNFNDGILEAREVILKLYKQ